MKTKETSSNITFSPKSFIRRAFIVMLSSEVFILLSDLFLNHQRWISSRPLRRFFNITREDSLANWFSSMQSLLVALVLLAIFIVVINQKKTSKKSWGWLLIGFFFAFMSLDDGSKLHERIGSYFGDLSESGGFLMSLFDLLPSYGWQIILGPVFIFIGLYIAWFLWRQLRTKKQICYVAFALILFAVAMGLDFVEGLDIASMDDYKHYMKAVEEFFEMFANTLFLVTFLDYLFYQQKKIQINLEGDRRVV